MKDLAVHTFSGELLVGGATAGVWNLTGSLPKWSFGFGVDRGTFFGADDLFLLPQNSIVNLFKLQNGNPVTLWKPSANKESKCLSVSANGKVAAFAGYTAGKPMGILSGPGSSVKMIRTFPRSSGTLFVRLSPSGDRLAAVDFGKVDLIDAETGGQPVKMEIGDLIHFRDLRWISDRRIVAVATGKENRGNLDSEENIILWDADSGEILRTVRHRSALHALAVAPDGSRFAEAGADRVVRIRDSATLAVLHEFRAHNGPVTSLAWHPSRPVLATASVDLSIRIWDLNTGQRLEELWGPPSAPKGLTFSPGGFRLSCSSSDGTRIWEPESLHKELPIPQ